FSLPSMQLIGLLLLATSVQSGTEYVTVRGTIVCDSARYKHFGASTLLPHANIQLKEHDTWPFTDDVINTTITDTNGDFNITGSSDESWGNKFFIEIKIPCWNPVTAMCHHVAQMCTNRNCEYFVKKSIPDEMKYEEETNEAKMIYDIRVFNLINSKADERYSMCP
ncbi:hypothetical protein PRIPAC_90283, partial [Pristionchus pacificus]